MAEVSIFDIDLSQYRAQLQAMRDELAQLTQGTDEYNQKQQELANTTQDLANAVASSAPSMNELKAVMKELKQDWSNANDEAERGAIAQQIGVIEGQMKSMNQELKNTAQDAAAAEGSYNQLVVKMRELQQAAKATSDATERLDLSRQANEINEQLKGMDAEMGNYQRNVGSYEQSIESAFGQIAGAMGPVAKATGGLGKAIGGLDGPIKMAVGAVGGLGKAFKSLKAAMASNPIGLAVTAIVAAGSAIYSFIKAEKEAEAETKRIEKEFQNWKKELRDVDKESAKYAASELARADALYNAAIHAAMGTKERTNAVKGLIAINPTLLKGLDAEKATNEELKNGYYKLADSIWEVARAKAASNLYQKNMEEYLQAEMDEKRAKDLYKKGRTAKDETDAQFTRMAKNGYRGGGGDSKIKEKARQADEDMAEGHKARQDAVKRKEAAKSNMDFLKKDAAKGFENESSGKTGGGNSGGGGHHRGSGSGSGHHRGSGGGHRSGGGSVKEETDAVLKQLEELQAAYDDFSSAQQDALSYTLERIENNVGDTEDFENRAAENIQEGTSFEIAQLERKKKANDGYYSNQISALQQYHDKLEELQKADKERLEKAENGEIKLTDAQKALSTKRVTAISAELAKIEDEYELMFQKQHKLQFDTSNDIDDELKKQQEEQLNRIQESYNAKNQNAQNQYNTEIGMAQQQYYKEEELRQISEQSQVDHLARQIENEEWFIKQLLTLYGENEPIVKEARARLMGLKGEYAQLLAPAEADPVKQQYDHIQAVIETANAIGDLTSSIADFWKNSINAQLEAGEISQEQAEAEFERIKAVEIASAVVTTLAGALSAQMSVWKEPTLPLWGKIAMSALLGAQTLMSGYAQIDKIRNTKIGSNTNPSITVANATPLLDEAADVNQLDAISVAGATIMGDQRVYILQSDIEQSGKQVEVRQQQSSF